MELDLNLETIKTEMQMLYGKEFSPIVQESSKWHMWKTIITNSTCVVCYKKSGTIFNEEYMIDAFPPLHEKCRCSIVKAGSIWAGTATVEGVFGADYTVKNRNKLPQNYISKQEAKSKGWRSSFGNLHIVAPKATIGGDVHQNKENKLPQKVGRVWYEADVNYLGGRRNSHRLIYSNDGLIFITYDHYLTFYEIV
ncbi:MAG: phage head morphogenesis protein [Clostridia bacterium]|nr:phage head morphogenesis protein [Clostridia bacterium]